MSYNPKDYYFKKAKEENYVARSVFKLDEIDKKFKLIKSGDWVMDLGASPGSWSQYTSAKIGPHGRLLAVDLNPLKINLKNMIFIQGDIREMNLPEILAQNQLQERPMDVVLSDMAPKTTGIRITDQARSLELCEMALEVAKKYLKPKGHLVVKLFHSDDFSKFRDEMKKVFEKVEAVKPDSTRKISKEIFVVGINKKI